MTYRFTKTDELILDFFRDNVNDILFQVEADKGKATYYCHSLKIEITFGEPDYDN